MFMDSQHFSVTAFLPCRKGSERVPFKNIRPFSIYKYGLIEIKLKQLLYCPMITAVVLSSNDDDILEYAQSLSSPKLVLHKRDERLASNTTSTDELIKHACGLVSSGHLLWTHVTSPFVNSKEYSNIISRYHRVLMEGADSLMTTTPFYGFLWNEYGPINYERSSEKWPRTQTLPPIYEINSAVFLASVDTMIKCKDRIGEKPFLYNLNRFLAFDIDWEEDFVMAEQILESGIVSV